jgi:hypothetical protein
MKKIIILFVFAFLATIISCKKITDLNENKKAATKVPSEFLFSNAIKALVDQENTSSVNLNVFRAFSQYWTETSYTDESRYDVFKRKIPDAEFTAIYRDVLSDFKECKRIIDAETETESTTPQKKNKKAIVEILNVYAFQRLVDIFGDVPYENALGAITSPAYDDAKTIYEKLFTRLDAAIADLNTTEKAFINGDLIYAGNVTKWKAFAYSLKLKMAITVVDVSELKPDQKIISALAGGIITSSAGDAIFSYLDAASNYNPKYTAINGRTDWVAANTIIDIMNSRKDPRISKFFDGNLPGVGVYVGGVYGTTNSYDAFSHLAPAIYAKTKSAVLINYTELQFYLAEAAGRGIAGLSTAQAESYYNEGIKASILSWGGLAADATTYLNNPAVAYTTAAGADYKEKIGVQAWLAYYDRGLLGWTTWRRLDAPKFNVPPGLKLTDIPTRFTYPIEEQTLNAANYQNAAKAINGDKLTSKLFWDK